MERGIERGRERGRERGKERGTERGIERGIERGGRERGTERGIERERGKERADRATSLVDWCCVTSEMLSPEQVAEIRTPSRDAVLTLDELAAALKVSRGIAEKMHLPFFMAGARQRFVYGQVLDTLAKRARENAA